MRNEVGEIKHLFDFAVKPMSYEGRAKRSQDHFARTMLDMLVLWPCEEFNGFSITQFCSQQYWPIHLVRHQRGVASSKVGYTSQKINTYILFTLFFCHSFYPIIDVHLHTRLSFIFLLKSFCTLLISTFITHYGWMHTYIFLFL